MPLNILRTSLCNAIVDFKEKAVRSEDQSLLINGGVYILEPVVCNLVPAGHAMVENDIFPKLAKENSLFGYQIGKDWVHLHDKEKYEEYLKAIDTK